MKPLTQQQLGILAWLGWGLNSKQLASELGVSIKTIEWHMVQLKRRLGMRVHGPAVWFAHIAIAHKLIPVRRSKLLVRRVEVEELSA